MKKPAGEGQEKIILVSNKHVFWGKADRNTEDAVKNLRVTFHKKSPEGLHTLGTVHTFSMRLDRKVEGYYDHPDKEVDVACVNISDVGNQNVPVVYRAIDLEKFFNFERNDIIGGQTVMFVGYPTGFFDQKNFLPILRSGTIASIPSVDFNGRPQILIDAQVFPGSSGSPVFVAVNGQYKLLGIISDGVHKGLDFVELEMATETEKQKISVPREWIGLGLLFTNDAIKAVYDLV